MPINVNWNVCKIESMLKKLDGIIFTGGSQPFYKRMSINKVNKFLKNIEQLQAGKKVHPDNIIERVKTKYYRKLSYVLKRVREINDSGRSLPIWGVCQGFETMLLDDGETHLRLNQFDDKFKNHSIKLHKNDMENQKGSFAKFIKDNYMNTVDNKFFFFNHIKGLTVKNFMSDPYLKNKYNILAISDEEDFNKPRILEEQEQDVFNKKFYSDLKDKKIIIDTKDSKQLLKDRELEIDRIINYKSPFKTRILTEDKLKYIKTDFSTKDSTFISIVENKKYPFYGLQFHPEKPLYDFHKSTNVDVSDKTRYANESLHIFFLEKVLNGKIKFLKKELNLENDLNGYRQIMSRTTHNKPKERSLYILSQLRTYIFRSCKITLSGKGCRKFNYKLLDDINSNYQMSLSQQILLDYDEFYNKNFKKLTSTKKQRKYAKKRFLIRGLSYFDEVLLIK